MSFYLGFNYSKKYTIPIFFIWAITFSAQAQEIPALKSQLMIAKTDSSRIRILFDLGVKYEFVNIDSSIYCFNQSLALAQQKKDQKSIANAMNKIGFMYLYYIKDEAKAGAWLNKGLGVAKTNNDHLNISNCYMLLGVISEHQHVGNPLDFYTKALTYAIKSNDWQAQTASYELFSTYFESRKKYKEAAIATLNVLRICKKHDIDTWFSAGLDYCDLLDKQGKFYESMSFRRQLSASKNKLKQKKGYFVYMNDIGRLETKLKNYLEAENIFLKVLDVEKSKTKIDTFHLYFIFRNLETLYLEQGAFKKAWQASKNFAETLLWLQEKRQTQDSRLQMTKQKASLELEKKELEITLLEAQKNQQLIFLVTIIFFAILLICLMIFLHRNNQKIEKQKLKLSQLNSSKDKLFAMLSHDLRSPVASLKNYMMLIKWGALSQDEFAVSAKELNVKVGNIHNMLENVLNWSVSQMGGINPKISQTLIYQIIEEQIQLLKPLAESKSILIENQIPVNASVLADKNHLMIIFRNLLQNAIKFTHVDGKIIFNYDEKQEHSNIEVIDSGIGMTEEKLSNLFNIKTNTSTVGTSHEQGTGLGLVLVKELVEINKGGIAAFSEINKGTSFKISFPTK